LFQKLVFLFSQLPVAAEQTDKQICAHSGLQRREELISLLVDVFMSKRSVLSSLEENCISAMSCPLGVTTAGRKRHRQQIQRVVYALEDEIVEFGGRQGWRSSSHSFPHQLTPCRVSVHFHGGKTAGALLLIILLVSSLRICTFPPPIRFMMVCTSQLFALPFSAKSMHFGPALLRVSKETNLRPVLCE
jgi:hypothetical protein